MKKTGTTQTPRKISARKAPTQERAKQRVRKIMDSTRALLANNSLEKLSTNLIATTSGLPVGSLYQYFPNKQAILHALFEEWLEGIQASMLEFERKAAGSDLKALLDELFAAIYTTEAGNPDQASFEREMLKAMNLYPELQEVNRRHGEIMGERLGNILRIGGLDQDDETISELGLFIYSLDATLNEFSNFGGNDERAFKWFKIMVDRLLFEKH